jgi:hypothetical protein
MMELRRQAVFLQAGLYVLKLVGLYGPLFDGLTILLAEQTDEYLGVSSRVKLSFANGQPIM